MVRIEETIEQADRNGFDALGFEQIESCQDVSYAGEDVLDVAKKAYLEFFSENGLGLKAFPSLARFETEVIDMTLGLLHGPTGARGTMTSGGTESIFLAVKSARDWARKNRPWIDKPEIVLRWKIWSTIARSS